ncbi:hypothetical protein ACNJ7K_25870, partial [Rhodococcus aetherivorans]
MRFVVGRTLQPALGQLKSGSTIIDTLSYQTVTAIELSKGGHLRQWTDAVSKGESQQTNRAR